MGLKNFDLSAEIWGAASKAERKAEHKACRRVIVDQLRAINEAPPSASSRAQASWIAAKCRRCQGCSMAPH